MQSEEILETEEGRPSQPDAVYEISKKTKKTHPLLRPLPSFFKKTFFRTKAPVLPSFFFFFLEDHPSVCAGLGSSCSNSGRFLVHDWLEARKR